MVKNRRDSRTRRHRRIRKKVHGTMDRMRLSVYRSLSQVYAQIIDDEKGHTVVSASSLDSQFKGLDTHRGNIKTAKEVGSLIADRAREKGIRKVVFDRGGYLYHGRVKALAEAAREAGLEF